MDKVIGIAKELQAISRAGMTYAKDEFDKERYERIAEISAELFEIKSNLKKDVLIRIFENEKGYQTPKLETRGVVYKNNKIMLVKEHGKWALPGGWMDYDQTVSSNTKKEVQEESGMVVSTKRIIAILNRSLYNQPEMVFEVIKIFVECELEGGEFKKNLETSDACFFSEEEIYGLDLDIDKTTVQQLEMCFDFCKGKMMEVQYD